MMRKMVYLLAAGLVIAGAGAAMAQDNRDESGFDGWLSDSWSGPGWYVTDPTGGSQVPLKGPFSTDAVCAQNLPNDPNPNAESHRWYCQYFQTDPSHN